MRARMRRVLASAGVEATVGGLADDVEAVLRHGRSHDYRFLLNHGEREQVVVRLEAAISVLDAGAAQGAPPESVRLAPRGVAVLRLRTGGAGPAGAGRALRARAKV